MCITTIPQRSAKALIGHVAQNLLFLLSLFVQIEQIKNPISVLVLERKSRRSRNFFCAICTKIFNNVDNFCAKQRNSHLCNLHKNHRCLWKTFVQNRENFFYSLHKSPLIFLCKTEKRKKNKLFFKKRLTFARVCAIIVPY